MMGNKMEDIRSFNIGTSDYAQHKVQPWDIWIEYNFNPFEGDIVKRTLRVKSTDPRVMDYEKIVHISKECIRQLSIGKYNFIKINEKPSINLEEIMNSYTGLKEWDYEIIKNLIKMKMAITLCDHNINYYYNNIIELCKMGIEWENNNVRNYEPKTGDIVKHFKRETLENPCNEYLYEILGVGLNSETKEKYVVYKSLYSNKDIDIGHICCRPYGMFLSEVDHTKYPNIKQKYRFEKVD